MNTIFEFIASPENVKGFLFFLCAGFMLAVWASSLKLMNC